MASITLVAVCFLCSCTAPQPPVVNGKDRVPVNTSPIEFSKPLIKEKDSRGDRSVAAESDIATHPELPKAKACSSYSPPISKTFIFTYPFGEYEVLKSEKFQDLVQEAGLAEIVLIRARTDGVLKTDSDEEVARNRALSMRSALLEHGISPLKINLNYASAMDYTSENDTTEGRAKNRRVEVHLFN